MPPALRPAAETGTGTSIAGLHPDGLRLSEKTKKMMKTPCLALLLL
jgi:hypothetical protein